VAVHPPNAVRQRQAAIAAATGSCLLLLDDDVVLEPDCVEQLLAMLRSHPDAVAAVADFTNQPWPGPTRLWRFYVRRVLGLPEGAWQGRVVGPLLRFGYNPSPTHPMPMEWLGAGNSMVLHSAYERAGGFSNFFLHRCAMNEDVDLGLKLSRLGRIYLCPAARMRHEQAPGGRARATAINEDDLYNRYLVLHHTLGKSKLRALALVLAFFAVETLSNTYNSVARLDPKLVLLPLLGRARAIFRITALLATAARK
jgi:GT2 family glycosyltransferase